VRRQLPRGLRGEVKLQLDFGCHWRSVPWI
jgi:hypothetical protein